jgi:uncharacterized protein YnzC (UPF0291/DUF896 family)
MIRRNGVEFDEGRYMEPQEHNRWLKLRQSKELTEEQKKEIEKLEQTAERKYLDDVRSQVDSQLKDLG